MTFDSEPEFIEVGSHISTSTSTTFKEDFCKGDLSTLYTPDGEKTEPAIDFPEAFEAQLGQAVDALENGTEPTILSGTSARNSLMICLKEAESVRTGKTVRV